MGSKRISDLPEYPCYDNSATTGMKFGIMFDCTLGLKEIKNFPTKDKDNFYLVLEDRGSGMTKCIKVSTLKKYLLEEEV